MSEKEHGKEKEHRTPWARETGRHDHDTGSEFNERSIKSIDFTTPHPDQKGGSLITGVFFTKVSSTTKGILHKIFLAKWRARWESVL